MRASKPSPQYGDDSDLVKVALRVLWVLAMQAPIAAAGLAFARESQVGLTRDVLSGAIAVLPFVSYLVWCWTAYQALSGMDETAQARSKRQREQRDLSLATEGRAAVAR